MHDHSTACARDTCSETFFARDNLARRARGDLLHHVLNVAEKARVRLRNKVVCKGRTLPTIGWRASQEGVCVIGARFAL